MDDLNQAYNTYEQTANKAIEYNSAAALLPEKLKQAVNEKLDYNRELIDKKNELASKYFQAPSEARAKYADPTSANYVFNPFQAENLVSQYRNQAWTPYQTASDILAARTGSIAEGIKSATSAFNAEAGAQTDKASLARQRWADMFDVYKYQHPNTGGDGGGVMNDILDRIPRGQTNTDTNNNIQPLEPLPRYSPRTGIGAISTGGEWVYTGNGVTGWEPNPDAWEVVQ